jgi:outer membrane protein OmpA-like peptidoglycan-associated protein
MKKKFFSMIFFAASISFAQNVSVRYNGSGSYSYTERTDLRRYDNGKYAGLVRREIRSFIAPTSVPSGGNQTDRYFDGNFFVDEETRRNMKNSAQGINESIYASFKISSSGELFMIQDNGYPSFRSFPTFTSQKISFGDKWQGNAERIVDPLNKGVFTKLPILVEYVYLRDENFHGEEVYVFSAQWATRYGQMNRDFGGDRDLKSAQGSHRATMYVSKKSGNAIVVRDAVDESFFYADGNRYDFKGTISMFTEYPPAFNKEKLIPALQRISSLSESDLKKILSDDPENQLAKNSSGNFSDKNSAENLNGNFGGKNSTENSNENLVAKNSTKNSNENFGGKNSAKNSDGNFGGKNSAQDSDENLVAKNSAKNSSGNFSDKNSAENSDGKNLNENLVAKNSTENSSGNFSEKKSAENSNGNFGGKNSAQNSSGNFSGKNSAENSDENFGGKNSAQNSDEKNSERTVSVERTESGIRLTVQNLNFKADSAELLAGENERLDKIADVLRAAGDRNFLVEGHTAHVGNDRGEMALSVERAESVARELIRRGIPKEKFICKGSGGTKPVAENSTPQGKAKNRRVEITILE